MPSRNRRLRKTILNRKKPASDFHFFCSVACVVGILNRYQSSALASSLMIPLSHCFEFGFTQFVLPEKAIHNFQGVTRIASKTSSGECVESHSGMIVMAWPLESLLKPVWSQM
jgi:hypothetical protein